MIRNNSIQSRASNRFSFSLDEQEIFSPSIAEKKLSFISLINTDFQIDKSDMSDLIDIVKQQSLIKKGQSNISELEYCFQEYTSNKRLLEICDSLPSDSHAEIKLGKLLITQHSNDLLKKIKSFSDGLYYSIKIEEEINMIVGYLDIYIEEHQNKSLEGFKAKLEGYLENINLQKESRIRDKSQELPLLHNLHELSTKLNKVHEVLINSGIYAINSDEYRFHKNAIISCEKRTASIDSKIKNYGRKVSSTSNSRVDSFGASQLSMVDRTSSLRLSQPPVRPQSIYNVPQPTYANMQVGLNQSYYLGNNNDAYSSQLVQYSSQPYSYDDNMQVVPYVPASHQITLRDSSLLRLYPEITSINSVLGQIQRLSPRDMDIHNPSDNYIMLERDFCNFSNILSEKLIGSTRKKTAGSINDFIQKGDYDNAEKLIYMLYELKTIYMPCIPFMQAFMINKDPFLNDLASRFRNVVDGLKANADVRNTNVPLNTKIKLEAGISNGADALSKACVAASKTQEFINMCGSTSFAMPIILTINIIGKVSFMVLLRKDEKLLTSINDIYGDCDNIQDVMQSLERFICFAYNNIMTASLCSAQLDRINQLRQQSSTNMIDNKNIDIQRLIKDTNQGITLFDKKGTSATTNLKNKVSRMSSLNSDKREEKKLEQQFDVIKSTLGIFVTKLFNIISELNDDKSPKHLSEYKTNAEKLTQDIHQELIKLMRENSSSSLSTLGTKFTPNIEYIPISYGENKIPARYNSIVNR